MQLQLMPTQKGHDNASTDYIHFLLFRPLSEHICNAAQLGSGGRDVRRQDEFLVRRDMDVERRDWVGGHRDRVMR